MPYASAEARNAIDRKRYAVHGEVLKARRKNKRAQDIEQLRTGSSGPIWVWANDKLKRLRNKVKRVKSRKYGVSLTIPQLTELWHRQQGRCALSNVSLKLYAEDNCDPASASIDRIRHDRGYEEGNVRLVAACLNAFRGQMSDTEMLAFAKALVRRMKT